MRTALFVGLLLLATPGEFARAESIPPLATLKSQIQGLGSSAGQSKRVAGSAEAFVAAKAAYAARDFEKVQFTGKNRLFEDREQLLLGQARLARQDYQGAKTAMLRALAAAQLPDVGVDAARGLADALEGLHEDDAALQVLSALLAMPRISGRSQLKLRATKLLAQSGKSLEAADLAQAVSLDLAGTALGDAADQFLATLKRQGVHLAAPSPAQNMSRLRILVANRAFNQAKALLPTVAKHPDTDPDQLIRLKLRMLKSQRATRAELKLLEELRLQKTLSDQLGSEVLDRLARLAMNRGQDAQAIRYFDEMVKRFPDAAKTPQGAYLAAWLPYSNGDFMETHDRMQAFLRRFPKASQVTEAYWYAGWAAYLAKEDLKAQAMWTALIQKHPKNNLISHAHYWIGRSLDRQKQPSQAAYTAAIEAAPLGYYGFLARWRLKLPLKLGPAPKAAKPTTLAQKLEALGPTRPLALDRASALFEAGAHYEAEQELAFAWRSLRKTRDETTQKALSELLTAIGGDYYAYLLGRKLAARAGNLSQTTAEARDALSRIYPKAFERVVGAASRTHQVEDLKIWAIMRTESRFRPWVRSRVGARGLMQIMPRTARSIGKQDPKNQAYAARFREPDANVWLGGWYLGEMLRRYREQLALAAGAYNAGPRAMDRWLKASGDQPLDIFVERVSYKETRRYIRRVLETYWIYRSLAGLPVLITEHQDPKPQENTARF